MKRKEAEKLAIELGRFNFERGDDGFGGENVPHESAVKLLMGYVYAPPNCPACEKQTTSQYACTNNSCTQSNSDREAPAQPPCSECATLRKERDDYRRKWNDVLIHEDAALKSCRSLTAQLSTLRDALDGKAVFRPSELGSHGEANLPRDAAETRQEKCSTALAPTPEVAPKE